MVLLRTTINSYFVNVHDDSENGHSGGPRRIQNDKTGGRPLFVCSRHRLRTGLHFRAPQAVGLFAVHALFLRREPPTVPNTISYENLANICFFTQRKEALFGTK